MSKLLLMFGLPIETGSGVMPVVSLDESDPSAGIFLGDQRLQYDPDLLAARQPDLENGLFPLDPSFPEVKQLFYLGYDHVHALTELGLESGVSRLSYHVPSEEVSWIAKCAPLHHVNDVSALRKNLIQDIFASPASTDPKHWTTSFSSCLITINSTDIRTWAVFVASISSADEYDFMIANAAEHLALPADEVRVQIWRQYETLLREEFGRRRMTRECSLVSLNVQELELYLGIRRER